MPRPLTRPRLVALLAGALVLALALAVPDALANTVAPRDPRSPNASDIDHVYKVVVAIAGLIAIAVNVALVWVVLRNRAERGRTPARVRGTPRAQTRAAAAMAVIAVGVFVVGIVFAEKARTVSGSGAKPLRISVAGQQWLWRYTYPNGAFSYEQLVVPVNTTVDLALDSTDVVHRWWIPSLGGKFDAVPGRINHTWFRADREGVYDGQSAAYSGQSYAVMRGAVKVVSPAAYKSWIAQQKRDIQKAQAFAARIVAASPNPRAEAEQ